MRKRTRSIALAAVLTAFTVIFLYLANILPTVRMGLVAAASLFTIAAVIEAGIIPAVFVFVGGSVLGALLLPDKTTALIYVLFFGYYPIIKSLAERIRVFVLQWTVKIAVFEAALSIIWFFFKSLVFNTKYLETNVILIYLAGTAAFIVFDIGLSRLIGFYIQRISKNIKKNNQ